MSKIRMCDNCFRTPAFGSIVEDDPILDDFDNWFTLERGVGRGRMVTIEVCSVPCAIVKLRAWDKSNREIRRAEEIEEEPAEPVCVSPKAEGRRDRCGLYSEPPTCIPPDHCVVEGIRPAAAGKPTEP